MQVKMARIRLAKVLKKVLLETVYISAAVFVSVTFPLLFVSLLPVFAFRWLVAGYANRFRPDLGKILTTRSSMLASDNPCSPSNRTTLLVLMVLDGDLTPEEFKDTLTRKVLDKTLSKGDELLNPEMQQYLTKWMGFYFWKPESNFQLDDHIVVVPTENRESPFTNDTMLLYNTKLVEKPFLAKRSPWEYHLVRDYRPFGLQGKFEKTGLVFRCHHALADGFSVMSVLTSTTDHPFVIAQPVRVKELKPVWKTVFEKATFLFRIPYEGVKVAMKSYDFNELKLPEHKFLRSYTGVYHPLIPISRLKEIKSHYGVSMTSVILAICAGMLRNFMVQNKVKVPKRIHCMAPLPLPGHSEKLRNHMTACFTELPVGTQDPVERLRKIDKHLKTLKMSTFPWTASLIFQICGGLTTGMIEFLSKFLIGTAVVTNFPGPDRLCTVYNRLCPEINFGGGLFRGRLGIGMTCLSYGGMISFLVGLDKAICPKQESSAVIAGLITQEMEILESLMIKDV